MAVVVKRLFYRGTGGSSTVAPRYTSTFNNSGSWASSGDSYTISILQSVHGRGANPTVTVYENVASVYEEVSVSVSIESNGDVTISVTSTPDNRFTGKIVII